MKLLQKVAIGYAVLFLTVVVLGYIPSLSPNHLLFGLFKIDLIDDVIHLVAGVSAGVCAWKSVSASRWYLRIAGVLFGGDALMGLLTQAGLLDFTIMTHGTMGASFTTTNILINLPHILIAGVALYFGFVWVSKK